MKYWDERMRRHWESIQKRGQGDDKVPEEGEGQTKERTVVNIGPKQGGKYEDTLWGGGGDKMSRRNNKGRAWLSRWCDEEHST